MTYRLPSNLESFVPPPAVQASAPTSALTHPWRGTLIVSGMRASDKSSNQEIRVTAVETDGDNRVHTWPTHMVFSLASPYALSIMSQVQSYIRQNRSSPTPLCTILPDRLRDPNTNAVNLSNFRNLSRILYDNEMVALASLSSASTPEALPQAPPSSGILIFPASNSTALLVGALFLDGESFPEFVLSAMKNSQGNVSPSSTSPSIPISPSVIQARSQHRLYHQSEQRDVVPSGPFRPHEHMSSSTYPSTVMRYQHRQSPSLSPVSPVDNPNTSITSFHNRSQQYSQMQQSPDSAQRPAAGQYRYAMHNLSLPPVPDDNTSYPSPYRHNDPFSAVDADPRTGTLPWMVKQEGDDPSAYYQHEGSGSHSRYA
ncbi:uncharacterized protein EV420DRAFT_622496 [Desarmillaria tabescens]|uniref:Uncharacterized protein n=1 Tax=Armillaria tabescens TaxID=1929756 RepID=A0AA39N159_ARMTA|nr:uncharacterized protein EV420DRAFT_622496 [Desarmillaria tabescens]KAK0454142.1 hypothetical protein EV420DRAFT_622496 [Desarmillaria tabescens]